VANNRSQNTNLYKWVDTVREVAYTDKNGSAPIGLPRKEIGELVTIIAMLAYIGVVVFLGVTIFEWSPGSGLPHGLGLFGLGGFALAAIALRLGQRLRSKSALEKMEKDDRQPVLFLRPFDFDEGRIFRRHFDTFERDLANAISYFGPMIAVGKPQEDLVPLGACRVNLNPNGDEWKKSVIKLIEIARFVVVRCSEKMGEGTLWELETLLTSTYTSGKDSRRSTS
jgi:hypothetical protein